LGERVRKKGSEKKCRKIKKEGVNEGGEGKSSKSTEVYYKKMLTSGGSQEGWTGKEHIGVKREDGGMERERKQRNGNSQPKRGITNIEKQNGGAKIRGGGEAKKKGKPNGREGTSGRGVQRWKGEKLQGRGCNRGRQK